MGKTCTWFQVILEKQTSEVSARIHIYIEASITVQICQKKKNPPKPDSAPSRTSADDEAQAVSGGERQLQCVASTGTLIEEVFF